MVPQDRRSIVRWPISVDAKLKIADSQKSLPCQIKDINLKGIQISLAEKLEKDTFLKLRFFLLDSIVLHVEAWVVWHKAIDNVNIYGLYFSKIRGSEKEKIYNFVYRYCGDKVEKHAWQETRKGGEKMQKQDFEDRRIFSRFPANLSLRFLNLNNNAEGQAQTFDISAKGLGMVTEERLHPNTPLEMWLNIPDRGEPLYARGEVVWSNNYEQNRFRTGIELEKADLMGMARVLRAI